VAEHQPKEKKVQMLVGGGTPTKGETKNNLK
jgi:hypothetical protein